MYEGVRKHLPIFGIAGHRVPYGGAFVASAGILQRSWSPQVIQVVLTVVPVDPVVPDPVVVQSKSHFCLALSDSR